MNTTITGSVDTSDLSNLPLALPGSTQATTGDQYASMVAEGVSPTLPCPAGFTCTMLAGIPDTFVWGGVIVAAFAALYLMKGLAK
jgi:hypothetical protein